MKKILFLNTTKLAVLSAMLLLAVFCTIGMSFTPAEEGENVGNPNDSTYVTGPRRSHWKTYTSNGCGGYNTLYHHKTDYARVEAWIQVHDDNGDDITNEILQYNDATGEVKLSFNNNSADHKGRGEGGGIIGNTEDNYDETKQSTSFGTAVYLNWKCGIDDNEAGSEQTPNPDIDKAHSLEVTLTAKHWPNSDYIFAGWYLESNNSALGSEKDTVRTQIITIGNGGDGYTTYHTGATDIPATYDEQHRDTVKYYALYKPAPPIEVSLIPSENGSYTYKIGKEDKIQVSEESTISVKGAFTLEATPDEKYKFFGWYELIDEDGEKKEKYFSYETTTTATFLKNTTICAKFIPKDWATYIVRNKPEVQYYDFQAAADAASGSTDKVFLPIIDGVVPVGNYTITSGVTLLVPNSTEDTVSTNKPVIYEGTGTAPTPFRTLTLDSAVHITVNGSICVNAVLRNSQNSNGAQHGQCGMINMNEGSTITLNNAANLYCWGVIYGAGEITANSGSTVYESFQVNDYPGGSFLSPLGGELNNLKNHKVFPIRIYCFPNIQPKLHLHYGATEKVATVFASLGLQEDIVFISGSSGFFVMQSGSTLTKWYDKENDLQRFELRGDASLNGVSLSISSFGSVNSSDFILPVPFNMHMDVLSKEDEESRVTIKEDVAFLPGSKVFVGENVTVDIESDNAIYVYDIVQWQDTFTFVEGTNKSVVYERPKIMSYKKSGGDLVDAIFEVAGTIEVNGGLYTTSSGADIKGIDGGKVVFNAASLTTLPQIYQVRQYAEKTYLGTTQQKGRYHQIPITPAQLHNDESKTWNEGYEYTLTAGSEAGDEYVYNSTLGRWRCERKVTWDANGGEVSPTSTIVGRNEPLSLYFTDLPTPTRIGYTFNGWNTEADGTGSAVTIGTTVTDNIKYYAQWTFAQVGDPLDIVDADNTGNSLTINATSFALSGWPYTINDVEYARPADRMLTIPYGDKDPDEEIVIEVKDKEGTVVSYNMYIVPFVYTSDATLSGTDENSIVFVKSGTLTVGDASAKEIYVAPGAALQVNENGTLDVKKLVLRTTPFEAAILTNKGTIVGQVYYSRIARDADFHLFAIPAGSNTANVVLSDGTSAAVASTVAPYGNAWQLREYNTARRAKLGADGANWDNIGVNADKTTYSDVDIEASKGYELRSGSKYYREYLFPVTLPTTATSVQVTDTTDAAGAAAGAAHAGWNILCSPYTDVYKVEYDPSDPTKGITVSWQQPDGSYTQVKPTVIPPAVPFAYQASASGSLDFSTSTLALKAPRRQSAAEALTETEWVHLDIFDAYGEGDETSLFVHPTRFEQTYKTGIDMAKQSLTASRPIIYNTHAYGDMAFAGVADSLLENGIDLVVYSPAAQELTFSLRENKFLHRLEYLWLADNETGARTDLLMNDYTFRADAGTAKGRFVLNGRFKAPQISTGIGNTQTDYNIYAIGNNIAISGVEQGTPIYVFDAVGHMIYTTAATTAEVIVPAPCAGVYMLSVGGQTAKLVINQ